MILQLVLLMAAGITATTMYMVVSLVAIKVVAVWIKEVAGYDDQS